MKKNDMHIINSWVEFKSLAENWKPIKGHNPYAFRGQSKQTWKLETSLHRKLIELGIGNQHDALDFERQITDDFRKWSKKHLQSMGKKIKENDLLSLWELMQHYGAPTRLLDWSSSPFIACYFAVFENFDEDASIYSFDAAHLLWIQSLRANENEVFF